MMGSKAFESPLISHARMRGLYRALVETRELSRVAGRGRGWPKGVEACYVATALDLQAGDLIDASAAAWLVTHVRGVGARAGGGAATLPELKRSLLAMVAKDDAPAINQADRLLCAVGQAMALKAQGAGVVVAYVDGGALGSAQWARVLEAANRGELPLLLVALPGGTVDVTRAAEVVSGAKIPVIPVDAGDTLALYRVAQETILRARSDGGVAVIECVDCGTDPVRMMGAQLVKKSICTERWVQAVGSSVRRAVAGARG